MKIILIVEGKERGRPLADEPPVGAEYTAS